MSVRLSAELRAARLVGRISRAAGRGGGTTLPGKLLWKLDPGAIEVLAARLPQGTALVSATNGKTTTAAMAAEILSPRHTLAWNRSGANLASGVASALLAPDDAELGLLEVDEFALPEIARRLRPRALVLGNLFRDQLDRYGELEHVAERWRGAVAVLEDDTRVAVNADDPLVASLAEDRPGALRFGIDDPLMSREGLQHAADSKYCRRCGAPYDYDAIYVGHLGDYRCPSCAHARPRLDVAAREIRLQGLDGATFRLETGASGAATVRLPLPGLYNVYNALAAASLCLALDVPLGEIVAGLARVSAAFGRLERIDVGDRSMLVLLVKNPAGANEAIRTLDEGGVPATLVVALNDAVADGRDVSWIWDVDLEPLFIADHVVVSGDRAAELALRFTYGGYARDRLEVVPDLEQALDRGLLLAGPGGRLGVLPTYTAMLAIRAIAAQRGHVRPYWMDAA